MLIACWSVKGGVGTSVFAASLALTLARGRGSRLPQVAEGSGDVLLVDLAGDLPAVLGLAEPTGPGVADWLRVGDDVPDDGLRRIEIEVADHLTLIPRGRGDLPVDERRSEVLAAALAGGGRSIVVDCGRIGSDASPIGDPGRVLAGTATQSVLVMRSCYLALRRAVAAPLKPSVVVVIDEPGRALDADDVQDILGVPVLARVPVDAAVARAVDAGLLVNRLPRSLERALRSAAA